MAKSDKSAPKGKLELMLNEFTDVHGTVLLGMHKELQTLRADIEHRVESRIAAILEQTQAADAQLIANIEKSENTAATLNSKTENLRSSLKQEEERLHALIEDERTKLEQASAKTSSAIEASRRDLLNLAKEVEQRRTEFTQEIDAATDEIAKMLSEHDSRVSAAVKFVDYLSKECASALKAANERYELLVTRESSLQARTRQIVIAAAIFSVATIGLWAWLLQKH